MEARDLGRRGSLGGNPRLERLRRGARLGFLLPLLLTAGCLGLWRDPFSTLSGRVTIDLAGNESAAPAPAPLSAMRGSAAVKRIQAAPSAPSAPDEYIVYLRQPIPDLADVAAREGLRLVSIAEEYAVLRDPARRGRASIEWTLAKYPGVDWVEPNGTLYPLALPDDPDFPSQWALERLRLPEAWDVTLGDENVVVAVIDSGIDFGHPDLNERNLWVAGWDFTAAGAGRPYEFDPGDTARAGEHGTQVAGIIGRLTNNRQGGAGVAWRLKLMPLRVLDSEGGTGMDRVARAIRWAVEHGANVINLSLGCDPRTWNCPPSAILMRAIEYARAAGVAVVAAAGNYGAGGGPVMSPANYPGVIAVGATDRQNRRASYSAFGRELDLVAPGGDGSGCIHAPTLRDKGGHACVFGTSFAAPHVAGVIALMLAAGSAGNGEEAEHLLQMTAVDLGGPGFDVDTGWGLVDAYAAVSSGIPLVFAVAEETSGRLLAVGTPVRAGAGGLYRISGVPEGRWRVVAWVDKDGDRALSPGDFYGEHPSEVVVKKGALLAGLDIAVTRYEGPRREVVL